MSLNLVAGVLNVAKSELNLKFCLKGGMSFRWTLLNESAEPEFNGVIGDKIYFLKQLPSKSQIEFRAYSKSSLNKEKAELELRDYFRLNEDLTSLYSEWSQKDTKFDEKVKLYPEVLGGIRVLRLDPVENLFSFICSSNNNIKRITQMVSNMCIHFGAKIGKVDNVEYYAFPTIDRLAQKDVEEKLRKLSFGYRAKFIYQAAQHIQQNHKDSKFLFELREKPYNEVVTELIKIPGIGKKVADCISLMSLDKLEAIPVDTHVFSLAKNTYGFMPSDLPKKSDPSKKENMTDKLYKFIADKFRELWGEKAGWAQTVMFIDDLKNFEREKSESLLSVVKVETNESVVIKKEKHEADENQKEVVSMKRSISEVNVKEEKIIQSSKKKRTKTSV